MVAAAHAVVEAEAGGDKVVMNEEGIMKTEPSSITVRSMMLTILVAFFLCAAAVPLQSQSAPKGNEPSQTAKTFSTPQQAGAALIQAIEPYDISALLEIFGPDGKDVISSADPVQDKNRAQDFAAKARQKNVVTVDAKNKARAILTVGNDDWPFPVPIVKKNGKWYFDAKQGREEILFRRIGANELDAIQVCRGFVEAQHEYASEIRDDAGVPQYAQKIFSSPGKHDGLYWQNPDGTPGGPISEAVAKVIEEGYDPANPAGYHGYYFKVLKGQGPAAPLGQLDYVIEGAMIGGFALAAVPAQYRVTGVKTFIVSYNGIVYEKDLGPDSLKIVKSMERYNPDKTWRRTDDQWPADLSAAE